MRNIFIPNVHYQLKSRNIYPSIDVIIIGTGIMSSTLGAFLSILEPSWIVHIYERLDKPAQESSNAWNNAGTGHAAFCELNYTKYHEKNNSIDIKKAITINIAFELSLQFWSYLTQKKILNDPKSFINNVPHMSFVWGEKNISFLKKRFQELKKNYLFDSMVYSEDPDQIYHWIPLMMRGRNKQQKIAVTRTNMGTDVNFEEITKQLLIHLKKISNFKIYYQHDVKCINHINNKMWRITIQDIKNKQYKYIDTKYLFLGCGGQSLNLLQTAKIPEIKGYAGFPVGGQFLITHNQHIVNQHFAKVYGQSTLSMPPMSVPHLDTRNLNGKKILLFGPFATFSSKFLKYGSWLDLLYSINNKNLIPIIQSGIDNLKLIKYLLNQLIMSNKDRINSLHEYYPTANSTDWSLIQAGQRVQIIKKNLNNKNRGILQFGTEIITSSDKTISVLLGASPGASIAVAISINILKTMFYNKINNNIWINKLNEMVPLYNTDPFSDHAINLIYQTQNNTRSILNLLTKN